MNEEKKEIRCQATIEFGDDFGDNSCTFRCMLLAGHAGQHREWGRMCDRYPYSLEWEIDMREEEEQ